MRKTKVLALAIATSLLVLPIATTMAVDSTDSNSLSNKLKDVPVLKLDDLSNKDDNKTLEKVNDLLLNDVKVPEDKLVVPVNNSEEFIYIKNEDNDDNSNYSGKLFKDQVANIVEVHDDSYEVQSGDVKGFVKKSEVLTGEEAKKVADENVTVTATPIVDTKVLQDAKPSSEVIKDVITDEKLNVVSHDGNDNYVKVAIENQGNQVEGYVNKTFVLLKNEYKTALSKVEEDKKIAEEKAEQEKIEAEKKAAEEKAEQEKAAEEKAEQEKAAEEKAEQEKATEEKAEQEKTTEDNAKSENQASNSSSNSGNQATGVEESNVPSSSKGQAIANAALAQIGVGQDCTMLVTNSLRAVGIYYHGWPAGYFSLGSVVSASQAQPGDLIYYDNAGAGVPHIAVYVGGGRAVHGGYNGYTTVVTSTMPQYGPVFIRVR